MDQIGWVSPSGVFMLILRATSGPSGEQPQKGRFTAFHALSYAFEVNQHCFAIHLDCGIGRAKPRLAFLRHS